MKTIFGRRGLCAGAAVFISLFAASLPASEPGWLFAYFVGNGEDGLHLAASDDGYHWSALNGGSSYLVPGIGQARLMRDPSVALGPDGVFHLVWTSGWHENNIGHASTRDFITWSEEQEIPVMAHEPEVKNTWAPEVVWDATRKEFLIFWASTIPGRFPATEEKPGDLNHRIYSTTTKDWRSFSPTRLFYDPGFSVIDAMIFEDGGGYHLVIKDETEKPPKKHLRLAGGADLHGPWGPLSAPFTRDWVEGPTAIKVGPDWVIYYDCYRDKHYGAVRSRDLKAWEDVTALISLPAGVRHGTMFPVAAEILEKLRATRVAVGKSSK
jgi:hypothetical protein